MMFLIGSITCKREGPNSSRIEIRFSNVGGGNRNDTFTDNLGFTMGALSYEVFDPWDTNDYSS